MKTTKYRAAQAFDNILSSINSGGGNAGSVRLYTGSAPSTVEATATGTLLAQCTHHNGSVSMFGGTDTSTLVATGNTNSGVFAEDTSANATGTAGYARIYDYNDNAVLQCTVGTSGAEVNLSTLSIVSGAPVTITSATATISGLT